MAHRVVRPRLAHSQSAVATVPARAFVGERQVYSFVATVELSPPRRPRGGVVFRVVLPRAFAHTPGWHQSGLTVSMRGEPPTRLCWPVQAGASPGACELTFEVPVRRHARRRSAPARSLLAEIAELRLYPIAWLNAPAPDMPQAAQGNG